MIVDSSLLLDALRQTFTSTPAARLLTGVLTTLLLLAPVWWRARSLLQRPWADKAALVAYQLSGLWLAVFAGFVVTTLPPYARPVTVTVVSILLLTTLLAGRIESQRRTQPRGDEP